MGNVHEACMKYMAWGAEHFFKSLGPSQQMDVLRFSRVSENEPINSLVFLRVVASQAEVWCVTIILTCTSHATCPSCRVCVKDNGFICCKATTLLSILTFYYCDVFVLSFCGNNEILHLNLVVYVCRALCTVFHSLTRGHTHSKTTLLRWYTRYPKHTNPLKWWQLKEHLFQSYLWVWSR